MTRAELPLTRLGYLLTLRLKVISLRHKALMAAASVAGERLPTLPVQPHL